MASLDFVYDITDKLEEDNIEYIVLTLQEGKETDTVNIFYSTKPKSKDSILTALEKLTKLIKENDGNSSPKKRRRRKEP
jgi:hypothetical protein